MADYVKVNGAWKSVDSTRSDQSPASSKNFVKVSGVWKEADAAFVKVNGDWKQYLPKPPLPSDPAVGTIVVGGAQISPGQTRWSYDEAPLNPYEDNNPITVVATAKYPTSTVSIQYQQVGNPLSAWTTPTLGTQTSTVYVAEYGANVINVKITASSGASATYTVYFQITRTYTNTISYWGYCLNGEAFMGTTNATSCATLQSQAGNPVGWVCGNSPVTPPVCSI